MTPFQFLLACLACYRLTVLVSRDLGPFGLFKAIRILPWIGNLAGCVFCSSPWIAAAIVAGFWFSGIRDAPIVTACIVFAMSGVTIALDRIFTSDHET